jgi:hypothetical protein
MVGVDMPKLIKHIKTWNAWRKYNTNDKMHKFLVLIGFIHSPTMGYFREE